LPVLVQELVDGSEIVIAGLGDGKGNLHEARVLFHKSTLIKPNNSSAEYGLSLIK